MNTGGYIRVYAPEHPKQKDNYMLEHVLVMEEKLGRLLHHDERVHHRNGVKTDNRPENLELWVKGHPYGQRPQDLVRWAKEVLRRYSRDTDAA